MSEQIVNICKRIVKSRCPGGEQTGPSLAQPVLDTIDGSQIGPTAAQGDEVDYEFPESDIQQDLLIKDNGSGYALGLIAEDGTQSQIIGGVPEPATWAMMLLGLGAVGAAMRRGRDRDRAALAAA
jgi:hypothetical protein